MQQGSILINPKCDYKWHSQYLRYQFESIGTTWYHDTG